MKYNGDTLFENLKEVTAIMKKLLTFGFENQHGNQKLTKSMNEISVCITGSPTTIKSSQLY